MPMTRRRRTRTVKVRTALSRPCPAGQTDNGQLFPKIRTESGHLCITLFQTMKSLFMITTVSVGH